MRNKTELRVACFIDDFIISLSIIYQRENNNIKKKKKETTSSFDFHLPPTSGSG